MYWPRIVGLGLGFLMVAGALQQAGAPMWVWLVLVANGFVWPHVAYQWALRSGSPYHAEHRNLLIDSASGGFWLVAMGFNLLPSVLMLTMLSMDNVSIGGVRLLMRGLVATLIGALLAWPLFDGHMGLASNLYVIILCIPFMVTYPIFIGVISYRLSQQLSQQKREFEVLSRRDALSGLATRGHWETRLAEEYCRSRRHGRMAALLLADIDHFKVINDSHGHLIGDMAIRLIGQALKAQARAEDCVGRYGGEEFALILPETSVASAVTIAQRIQRTLATVKVPDGPDLRLTVSIGIAELSAQVSGPREWISRADSALYRAKRSGRDCICVFGVDDAVPKPA